MSETKPKIQRDYPRTIQLDTNTEVSLRLMTPADTYRVVAFARSLPADDLLFLRMDITKLNVVAHWGQNVKEGSTMTVLATGSQGVELRCRPALVQQWQRK